MRIQSRKIKPKKQFNKGQTFPRNNYRNYDFSSVRATDFARQNQSFRGYSKYKYFNTSRPKGRNGNSRFSCPDSPVLGSEECMLKRIEQTSAIIMKQLLNPDDKSSEVPSVATVESEGECSTNIHRTNKSNEISSISNYSKSKIKTNANYDIEEIHNKIMNHITKLNDGKKKNLINSNKSGYDAVIEQIQKQRRLEISQVLRAMCSQSKETQDHGDFISSIIPDIGIKIEDLPHDIIEELRNTLNLDPEWNSDDLIYQDINAFSLGMY